VSRILIAFGTTDGQTEKIARYLGSMIQGANAIVSVQELTEGADPDPAGYGLTIVAASVHAGGYQRPVRRWAAAHAADLTSRHSVFVSVCLGVLQHDPKVDRDLQAIIARFLADTGWRPRETKIVAGALKYTKYSWLKRWMMRRIAGKAGGDTDTSRDYEYTDWNDLRAFAERLQQNPEAPAAREEMRV
jgi:menaquinone-dependent protoporphyrinogen oxidase